MEENKEFLLDVELKGLHFPINAISAKSPSGQPTIAHVSINARIKHSIESSWSNKIIQIIHQHRDCIGTKYLSDNIMDYFKALNASSVIINFNYPFFVEKLTPVSKEKNLVRYVCNYSAKKKSLVDPKILFKIEVPVITSFVHFAVQQKKYLTGQLSVVTVEIESTKDIYPEEIISLVEEQALSPVYSFLTEEDEDYITNKMFTEEKNSIVMINTIKSILKSNEKIEWCSVKCSNYGMFNNYSTLVQMEQKACLTESSMGDEYYGSGGI